MHPIFEMVVMLLYRVEELEKERGMLNVLIHEEMQEVLCCWRKDAQ
jgi:hypothetical protein